MTLKEYLAKKRNQVNAYLKDYFSVPFQPERLYQSVTYSLFAGGKRIRPILTIASFEACGGKSEDILPQAAAIELVHTYSLIHDDLPAMDNDDFRRGKPTNHKVFGDAIAILAGDTLLTEAFTMFTERNRFKSPSLLSALRVLANAAGARGMVGGQAEDILSEGRTPDPRTVHFIHTHKTGAMIAASVQISPILAGSPPSVYEAISTYGENVGLAFQIVDDILDVTGDEKDLGKSTGTDSERGKITYPALHSVERSKAAASELIEAALTAVKTMGDRAFYLTEIAKYILKRTQ